MGAFCIATGVQPSEYRALTIGEREGFLEAMDQFNRQRKR